MIRPVFRIASGSWYSSGKTCQLVAHDVRHGGRRQRVTRCQIADTFAAELGHGLDTEKVFDVVDRLFDLAADFLQIVLVGQGYQAAAADIPGGLGVEDAIDDGLPPAPALRKFV